jgi:hypothetical protein
MVYYCLIVDLSSKYSTEVFHLTPKCFQVDGFLGINAIAFSIFYEFKNEFVIITSSS